MTATIVLPDAAWQRQPGIAGLVAALGSGDTVRIVGGAVRDTLRGARVSDIDMATRLQPDEVIVRLERAGIKAVPTGLAHGTITAVSQGQVVEVTTLRRDVATDGRHAQVAFTDDWREDAARRDFTINALYADPDTGAIFDYFGGIDDLAAGRVAFIGAPLARIAEDHLRILRFFRFHARFGRGDPDRAALDACTARANDLMALSRERIADELLKLLMVAAPVDTIALMIDRGIFKPVLPEICATTDLARLVARESKASFGAHPLRRLAALIGPEPVAAASIAARLKLSKAQASRLTLACGWTEPTGRSDTLAYWIGREPTIDRLLISDSPIDAALALRDWVRPRFPLSGGPLIARGVPQGPLVAKTLRAIETEWADKGFPQGADFEAIVSRTLAAAAN